MLLITLKFFDNDDPQVPQIFFITAFFQVLAAPFLQLQGVFGWDVDLLQHRSQDGCYTCMPQYIQLLDYVLAATVMIMSITGHEKIDKFKKLTVKKVLKQGEDSGNFDSIISKIPVLTCFILVSQLYD